jgi:probable phosphoglycerate mutase
MGRLLLVRHGESGWNRERIVQGQDGPGLTERGHAQAAVTGAFLHAEAGGAVLAVSDLPRCRETAEPYETAAGSVVVDERLRERHFGAWQGRAYADLDAEGSDAFRRWQAREDVIEEIGGESTPMLVDRVLPALREYAGASPLTVVVTHGGPIWHGVHALAGLPEPTLGPPANAAVTVVDLDDDGGARILAWNQVAHQPASLRTTWHHVTAA